MGSNLAYFAGQDLGTPVENQVRDIGDFVFDLRWKVGDLASINAALEQYGVEVIEKEQPPSSSHATP